jgi:hypothetical protein
MTRKSRSINAEWILHVGRIPGFADDREVIARHVMQSVPDWIGRSEMPAAVTEHPGIGPCTDDFGNERLPIEHWHAYLGDPTFADAILDRVVHAAHKLTLKGESMRKKENT